MTQLAVPRQPSIRHAGHASSNSVAFLRSEKNPERQAK